jgi:hypothetical protein
VTKRHSVHGERGSYIQRSIQPIKSHLNRKSDLLNANVSQQTHLNRFWLPAKLPANRNEKVRAGSSRVRLITKQTAFESHQTQEKEPLNPTAGANFQAA